MLPLRNMAEAVIITSWQSPGRHVLMAELCGLGAEGQLEQKMAAL